MTVFWGIFTVSAVTTGLVFFLAGTVGLLRFPDALTRLHALTKADNLGLGLIMLGLLPQCPDIISALKLVAIWALVLFAGASTSQLIAQFVRREGASPEKARPPEASPAGASLAGLSPDGAKPEGARP